jgi:hypothetical protein
MARFLVLWHRNPVAPWPTDPAEYSKLQEKMWAGIDLLTKKGEVKDFSYFLDGTSGYAIGEGEAVDTFRDVSMFTPFYECEVHEIIPYEKGKEILRTLLKAQIASAHKGA